MKGMFMAKIERPTAWVGWIFFAASLLVLIGAMQLVQGLGAILNPDYFVATKNNIFVFDLTTWGWIHALIGVVALAAGIGTMAGAGWARIVAIVVTALAMLGSIAYLTVFPLWATFVLVVGGFIIYALTVHGAETNDLL